jgi:hypothetical protein
MSRDAVPPGVRRRWRLAVNPNVEKAANIVAANYMWRKPGECEHIALRLDSAGLLVSELHEKALKACEELSGPRGLGATMDELLIAEQVGRESLAAKQSRQPVERWTVASSLSGINFGVVDNIPNHPVASNLTEQQARAVAKCLNDLEASRANDR